MSNNSVRTGKVLDEELAAELKMRVANTDVDEMESEHDDEEELLEADQGEGADEEQFGEEEGEYEDDAEGEEQLLTLADVFAGRDSVRLRIVPRVHVNVVAREVEVPKTLRINGAYYSVNSPLRKGEGTKKDPNGLVRNQLAELAKYIGDLRSDVVLYGNTADFDQRMSDVIELLESEVHAIMYSPFDLEDPVFSFTTVAPTEEAEATDEEGSDLDGIGVTEVSVNASMIEHRVSVGEAYSVACLPMFDEEEDGTVLLRPTVVVNVNVPMLVGRDDIAKPLVTMQKIVNNYAKAVNLAEGDFRLAYVFDSPSLTQPVVLATLQHFTGEESKAVVIGHSYLRECVESGADEYGVYPVGYTLAEAQDLIMSGNDLMLIL